ncbi:MAG TPA: TetR family transcriptional regulator C-terminal domain-containing protein [bacterium]|nr:TetR family transcriptional regulator C-terminal domain-containing protein [bacterium]HPN43472.1 TetR family transcriptional regulator C-terminal domain-containing protein [bacterium]
MKRNTKELILEKGAEIIQLKGFHHTGIQEILHAAEVPKGSFYFYFKSKEDFGLQLVDFYSRFFLNSADTFFKDNSCSYLQRLVKFFNNYQKHIEKSNYIVGCPIGNLAQELGDINILFRGKLNDVMSKMKDRIRAFLSHAQQHGELAQEININNIADFIFNSWEGALLRTKVTKNSEPLLVFNKMIFETLLSNHSAK